MSSSLPLILDKLREVMDEAPPEFRSRLLGLLVLELPTPPAGVFLPHHDAPDSELLTPDQAAAIAKVSKRTILDWTRGQNFRRKRGHRTVRFEASGFHRWITARAGR